MTQMVGDYQMGTASSQRVRIQVYRVGSFADFFGLWIYDDGGETL